MKISTMRNITAVAVTVLLLSAAGLSCGAGMGHNGREKENRQQYETVSRVVLPGQSLWDICAKLDTAEDIRDMVDRCRLDNDIKSPGTLQPGTVLMIRVKK